MRTDAARFRRAARQLRAVRRARRRRPARRAQRATEGEPDAAAPRTRTRWVLVGAAGRIEAQPGGFTVQSGYGANPAGVAGNVCIDAGEDLAGGVIVATIALQNAVDQDGDAVMNGRAPAGTNVPTSFVVSPRDSGGSVTTDSTRKRFSAAITG